MRIVYFGKYNPDYPRVRTIIDSLRENGIEVLECNTKKVGRVSRLVDLFLKFIKIQGKIDFIFVSAGGQSYVALAWLLNFSKRKPIIFDAFFSYYHVNIVDSKKFKKTSLKAIYYYCLDKISCALSSVVLLDTVEHIEYFKKEFNLGKTRFISVPVGSIYEDKYSVATKRDKILNHKVTVFCVLSYYPLHGAEYIVEAAKIIEERNIDVTFLLVGEGDCKNATQLLAKKLGLRNINFQPSIYMPKILNIMSAADICLGQFGNTEQSGMVIPIKVYDSMAMGKPIITRENTILKKLFENGKEIFMCPPADPEALARQIILLAENEELREVVGENARRAFLRVGSRRVIFGALSEIFS